ncbi:MAG: shikimate kinase [Clostridiales bacterium]|nr:shikimate kinase [Clostridiales bacterium]
MLRCGLLGRTLGHSYSPAIHAELGDYEYKLYEKEPQELAAFLQSGEFDALNVTIPYKKDVMAYCAALSPAARRIGSVNTLVRRKDGTLYGDNTDADGFAYMVKTSGVGVAGKKALVFGSGGASVTACDVLKTLGASSVTVISRSGPDNYENLDRHADAEILVNTTPVGMYPKNGASPVDLTKFPNCCGVFDVVYNPARTALLLQAEKLGVRHAGGLPMLVAQARRASELFTGSQIADAEIVRIERKLAREMQNIVLVGMPGCGKSVVGAALAKRLGRPLLDSDALVTQTTQTPIPEFFRMQGEGAFRALETQALRELGKRSGAVIATGGGSVLREENYDLLHQNGVIVWLRRELSALPIDGRPVSQSVALDELYRTREPRYRRFADCIVDNCGSVDDAVNKIMEALHETAHS